MPRTCTVCRHPNRPAIDKALVNLTPYRTVAHQNGLTHWALLRHVATHLLADVVKAKEVEDVAHAIDIVKQLKTINQVSLAILSEARVARDPHTALKAVDRIQRQVEMQARLLGQIDDRSQVTVNILEMPEYVTMRTTLLRELWPYPEARVAAGRALDALEAGNGHAR